MPVERESVVGGWVHAHEEDTEAEMVLRPASAELPPSRGRLALELRADGMLIQVSPGPVDRPVEASGTWELTHEGVLVVRPADEAGWQARVVRAPGDRLVLSRPF